MRTLYGTPVTARTYPGRFMCYIRGGIPEYTRKHFPGCADPSPPKRDKPFIIRFRLYFADMSHTWENKGVAFLDPERDHSACTLGRIYLITRDQFTQVLLQENGLPPENTTQDPDLEKTMKNGNTKVGTGWYSLVRFLGEEDDLPVFTFTSPEIRRRNPPGKNYLSTIRKGLKECYPEKTE